MNETGGLIMKKLLAGLIFASMLFSLAACGTPAPAQTGSSDETPGVTGDLAAVKDKGKLVVGITNFPHGLSGGGQRGMDRF